MNNAFSYIIIFSLLLGIASCTNTKKKIPNTNLPPRYAITAEPEFKNQGNLWFVDNGNDTIKMINIEIADTDKKRETGLMHRKKMGNERGMLFIFPDERRQSFWMKDTHIPLDIIFVNAQKRIVHIVENCKPYSLKSIPSFEYAQYVVEVNAGFCQKYSVKVGQTIYF